MCSNPAQAAQFYASPDGSGSTCSDAAACALSTAVQRLGPGDTLYLKDGVYKDSIIPGSSGTSADPIVIRAENDGQATVDGEGTRKPLEISGRSHITVEGIVFRNSSGHVVGLFDSSNIILKRVSAYNASQIPPQPGQVANYHVFATYIISNSLLEDTVAGGLGRTMYTILDSSGVTLRRGYGMIKDHAGEGGIGTGIQIYGSSNCLVENMIITKFPGSTYFTSGIGTWANYYNAAANNNKYYGNIVYGFSDIDGWQFLTASAKHRIEPDYFENNVAIGGKYGFLNRGNANATAQRLTVIDALQGAANDYFSPCETNPECAPIDADYEVNTDLRNSVLVGRASTEITVGMDKATDNRVKAFTHSYNDVYNFKVPYWQCSQGEGEAELSSIEPGYDTATYGKGAYLIAPQALKGRGENGADIGAEVLYRYQDSLLTDEPLWPWPMEERIKAETGFSVTWESSGGLWQTLDGAYSPSRKTYYVATNGSDAYSCEQAQNIDTPKRTINNALSCLSAGDTLYIRAGTYNEKIVIPSSVSGNASAGYTSIKAYPGEKPVIDGTSVGDRWTSMIYGHHLSYLSIEGLHVTNYLNTGISLEGPWDHIKILNNEISHSPNCGGGHAITASSGSWYDGGTIKTCSDIEIDGNYIHHTDNGADETLTVALDVTNVVITDNVLENNQPIGIDIISYVYNDLLLYFFPNAQPDDEPWVKNFYIARNTIINSGSHDNDSMIYIDGGTYGVIEDNNISGGRGQGIVVSNENPDFTTHNIIVRRNRVNKQDIEYSTGGTDPYDVSFVHNVGYVGLNTVYQPYNTSVYVASTNADADADFKNNIFYNTASYGSLVGQTPQSNATPTFDYNIYYNDEMWFGYDGVHYYNAGSYDTIFENYQAGSDQDAHSKLADPLFISPGTDFHLQSTSPAIDAGGDLTQVTSPNGTGNSVIVADARYFFDGRGIEGLLGDQIRIGNDTVRVTNVNYSANTITFTPSITWLQGDPVNYVYSGAAPDMGAYEYMAGNLNIVYGDVSGDGQVSAYDAALAAQAVVGLMTFDQNQTQAADVSGDDLVSAYDAALIAQRAVGLIDRFPVEEQQ